MDGFFKDNNGDSARNSRGGFSEDGDFMSSFDKKYSRDTRDRSGGFFDRADRSARRLDESLPPIEQPHRRGLFSRRDESLPVQQTIQPSQAVQHTFQLSNVVIFSPESYDDVQILIDHLKRSEPAIVDFAAVTNDSAQHILDFLSGAIYALGGSMQRISGTIFLLTPAGVSISAPTSDVSKSIEDRRKKY